MLMGAIHRYRHNEQGELIYEGKSAGGRGFAERVGYDQCLDDQEQVWDLGDVVYQSKRMKRRDVKGAFDLVFAVLESLSARHGEDRVRLVVWFDG